MYKAQVKIFKSTGDKAPVANPRGFGHAEVKSDRDITGEVFSVTVTGQTLEEVTKKAVGMMNSNLASNADE